jgi:hypothetical protein
VKEEEAAAEFGELLANEIHKNSANKTKGASRDSQSLTTAVYH